MPDFLTLYGDTEGPLGFPMKDAEARSLEGLLDTLPEVDFRRAIVDKATTDLRSGERTDISWITTESRDRHHEVVLSSGMDDEHYRANPIVTLAHDYARPPIGRSLWRRRVREGQVRGVKAKTHYPDRPEGWTEAEWLPDRAFALIRAGLLAGKSIGFLTLEASAPTEEEVKRHPDWVNAGRIVRKWLLLEYACHWLPVNPDCCVEAVAKGLATEEDLRTLGVTLPTPCAIPFRTEEAVTESVLRQLRGLNAQDLARQAVEEVYDKLRGRV